MQSVRVFWRRFRRNQTAVVGLVFTIFILVVALLAPTLTPYDYRVQRLDYRLQAPTREHLMGTDEFGRDLFSRIIQGTRTSMVIGISATVLITLIGTLIGLLAGYLGGKVDWLLMRVTDVFMSIPSMFLMIVVVALFGASLRNTILVIAFVQWTGIARIVRANALAVKGREYVEAALALGSSRWRIILRHVLPNVAAPIIVWCSLFLGRAILLEAGLSYLGLGAQPPMPSWGNMVADGQRYLRAAWWQSTFPGVAILLTVLAFNLVGDGIRDALDPKMAGIVGVRKSDKGGGDMD